MAKFSTVCPVYPLAIIMFTPMLILASKNCAGARLSVGAEQSSGNRGDVLRTGRADAEEVGGAP